MKREYQVVFEEIEDGWILATVPDLPGAVTQGRDLAEARSNIQEAIELILESYREQARKQLSPEAIRETVTLNVTGV